MSDTTLLHVVCHNDGCVHRDRVRTVRMPYLGDGVYARPSVACECNPLVDMRMAFTTPDGSIYDEIRLSEPGVYPHTLIPANPEPTEPPC